jgi:hypothetical protein
MSGVNNVYGQVKNKSLCSIYQYCSNYCWYKWYFAYFPNNSRVTGGIGMTLKTGQKLDSARERCFLMKLDTLEEVYSVATGTVLTINTKTKKLLTEKRLIDISASLTPQKWSL